MIIEVVQELGLLVELVHEPGQAQRSTLPEDRERVQLAVEDRLDGIHARVRDRDTWQFSVFGPCSPVTVKIGKRTEEQDDVLDGRRERPHCRERAVVGQRRAHDVLCPLGPAVKKQDGHLRKL